MITLSLPLNSMVLLPVRIGMAGNAEWARACYGEDSPARRILLSAYLAIGLASATFLFVRHPAAVAALLLVQIVYKVTTLFTVGTIANPVVISNLAITAFHAVTFTMI